MYAPDQPHGLGLLGRSSRSRPVDPRVFTITRRMHLTLLLRRAFGTLASSLVV